MKHKPINTRANLISETTAKEPLQIDPAKIPMLRPRGSQGFLAMARNPLERSAACVLSKVVPDALLRCDDPAGREFLFRCLYVPFYCMGAIKFAVEQIGTPPFAMWEFAAYVRAMERFVLEMIFCQGWHKAGTSRPKTLFDFFAPLPAGQTFWIRRTEYLARTRRFEEWQLSASKSYLHFIRKQAPDIRACY